MKCFYCDNEAVGMKATDYFSTSVTCFRSLCRKHWDKVRALYSNEGKGDFDKDDAKGGLDE